MSDRRGGGDGQLWQHAVALYRTGRWHDALACCRELIATAPPKAEVLAHPGMLVLHLDHPVSAVDFLSGAIRQKPDAQATVLDCDGSLAPHAHYSRYVSGIYYVRIPAFVAAAQGNHAGWFEIGRPPARFFRRGRPEVRSIEPRAGTMLLFPSYFFHSTVPFPSSRPVSRSHSTGRRCPRREPRWAAFAIWWRSTNAP
jgi:hypothetical protein